MQEMEKTGVKRHGSMKIDLIITLLVAFAIMALVFGFMYEMGNLP